MSSTWCAAWVSTRLWRCSSSPRRRPARPIYKVLESAVANAETTEDLDRNTLVVSKAMVDEGPTMKRWRPRAQGRASRINKRTSHITLVVQPAAADKDRKAGKK